MTTPLSCRNYIDGQWLSAVGEGTLESNTVQLNLSSFSLRPSLTRRCANAYFAVRSKT